MDIGNKIKQLRKLKKMNQNQLVKNISSTSYLSRIENGKIKPSKAFLEKIALRLNISIKDLTEGNIRESNKIMGILKKNISDINEEEYLLLHINSKESYQQHILVQIFTVLINFHIYKNMLDKAEESYNVSKKVISLDFKPEYNTIYSSYFISCGKLFYLIQLYHKADKYFTLAQNLIDLSDKDKSSNFFYNMSLIKQKTLADKSLCLYYSKRAYEIFMELGNNENICKVLITRGVQFHLTKNYKNSKAALLKAREYLTLEKNRDLEAMIEYNLGRVFQGMGELDNSIIHFKNSIKINAALNLNQELVYSLRSLIQIYQERKKWDEAQKIYEEAMEIVELNRQNYLIVEIKGLHAKSYYMRGDFLTYEKEMQKIIDLGIRLDQKYLVQKLSIELANYFFECRSYKKASIFYQYALNKKE